MKIKIRALVIAVLFMVSCGSPEDTKQEEAQLQAEQNNKITLKASTNMYVVLGGDSILIANEPDASKAEVFEKIDVGNGKFALKTSKGKFVSDDRNILDVMIGNRNDAYDWEQFEFITTEGSKASLKSSAGKFVCADRSAGDKLYANRDQAGEWETFIIEVK